MNKQVKAAIGAVRDFIAGQSAEAKEADLADKASRQVVAAELIAAMSSDKSEASADQTAHEPDDNKSRHTRRLDKSSGTGSDAGHKTLDEQNSKQQEQGRARQLFLDHGYFDDAVKDLRGASSAAERASAARALGLVGSQRATAHLIAAMFDDDAEVRSAAEEGLAKIGDPNVASESTSAPQSQGIQPAESKRAKEVGVAETNTEKHNEAKERSGDDGESAAERYSEEYSESSEHGRGHHAAKSAGNAHETGSSKGTLRDKHGRFVPASTKGKETQSTKTKTDGEAASAPGTSEPGSAVTEQTHEDQELAPESFADSTTAGEEEQLLLEENAVRETVEELERQYLEAASLRQELEKEGRLSTEREIKLRTAAVDRRAQEEELRLRAAQEADRLSNRENEALAAEQEARSQAEAEAHRLAEEEGRLRLEAASLRLAAEELARERMAMETARREAAEAALHAEATRARQEAKSLHEAEVALLRSEEESLSTATRQAAQRRAEVEAARQQAESEIERLKEERAQLAAAETARRTEAERVRRGAEERNRAEQEQLHQQLEGLRHISEEVAARRAEVQAAREKADAEAERLLEAQARMRASEDARNQAEVERLEVEAEINRRLESEHRLLAEARQRAQEEQQRFAEETRRHREEEEERLANLELLRTKSEVETRQRVEKEQHILGQIDSLRIADAEARKRIEDAETRRRNAEEAYRLVAEKVQRVETEAHLRSVEEEQMLAKLETVRRSVAVEAQGRAEQEKRIKEEIEMFRRLEEEERPRLESAILQRSAAEAQLQQAREQLKTEEQFRQRTDERIEFGGMRHETFAEEAEVIEDLGDIDWKEPPQAPTTPAVYETASDVPESLEPATEQPFSAVQSGAVKEVPPAVSSYLRSVDPYKRAAAVSELARSNAKDALSLIADCFEDHSPHVRNAAARALRILEPTRTVDLFNRVLEGGSAERRRNIGTAIADSGLAAEAIDNLVGENREDIHNALSILFLMAQTGEVQPLVQAIEQHNDEEVRRAVVKLLSLSGQSNVAEEAQKRRLNGKPIGKQ